MVEPVTMAALATIGVGSKILGGMTASARAKAQAEIASKQAAERIKFIDAIYNRKIAEEQGLLVSRASAGNVAMVGSSAIALADAAYDKSLEKHHMKVFELQRQTNAEIGAQLESQAAWGRAAGGVVGTATTVFNIGGTKKKTEDLQKEQESPEEKK